MEAYQHPKRDFSPNTRPRVPERKFGPQDGSQNGPRSAQDGSKRLLKRNFFALENRLKFALVLGAILVRFWLLLGGLTLRTVPPMWGLEADLFWVCDLCHIWSPPRRPKRRPRGPKTPPRASQEAPRGRQERPRRLQEGLKSTPGGSKKASRAAKLHPRCLAKMPCHELTNGHAESSRAGGGVPPKGKAIRRPPRRGGATACQTNRQVPNPHAKSPNLKSIICLRHQQILKV